VIALCFVLGFYVSPVATSSSSSSDLNGDGITDSVYTASISFLNKGQVVSNRPFSLTSDGQTVTDIKISVSWTVGGSDINWASLQIHGTIDFKYDDSYSVQHLFKSESFAGTGNVSSWTNTYSLASMCTTERIGENYLGDTWDFYFNIVVSAAANDNDGKLLSATAPAMYTHIVIIRIAGTLTISATGGAAGMDATGGGISLTNPAVLCLVAGVVLIVISVAMRHDF